MSCLFVNERRLFHLAHGSLRGRTQSLVAAHVDGCPACRTLTSEFEALMERLRGGAPRAQQPKEDSWRPVLATLSSPDWLVLALADATVFRDSISPLSLVMQHLDWLMAPNVNDEHSVARLAYLTVWLTEMGLDHLVERTTGLSFMAMVEAGSIRFQRRRRSRRPVAECLHLELTAGMIALNGERNSEAIERLGHSIHLAKEAGDPILLAATQGALARAYARLGHYDKATRCGETAIETAQHAGFPELAAAHQARLAWTLFQIHGGRYDRVERLLVTADQLLGETEDRIGRGNVAAARAKIASHNGQYERAIELYTAAIELYEEFWSDHPNLARALLNRAKARLRTVARLRRMDRVNAEREQSGEPIGALLESAARDIEHAGQIYPETEIRGRGSVRLARAFWGLCSRDLQRAALEAAAAYDIGYTNEDHILVARARVMQCNICRAESETPSCELGHRYRLLERALAFSEEATRSVATTQHRRLATTAWLARGLVLAQSYFARYDEAADCLAHLNDFLSDGTHDYLREQVDELRTLVARGQSNPHRLQRPRRDIDRPIEDPVGDI